MRPFGMIRGHFWHEEGRVLRGNALAQLVVLFLMSAEVSESIGLFRTTIGHIADCLGHGYDDVKRAVRDCVRAGVIEHDAERDLFFLRWYAQDVYGPELKPEDNKVQGIKNALTQYGAHPFVNAFLEQYGEAYCITPRPVPESPADTASAQATPPLNASSDAAPKKRQSKAKAAQNQGSCPEGQAPSEPLRNNKNESETPLPGGKKNSTAQESETMDRADHGGGETPPSGRGVLEELRSVTPAEQKTILKLYSLWAKAWGYDEQEFPSQAIDRAWILRSLRTRGEQRTAWVLVGGTEQEYFAAEVSGKGRKDSPRNLLACTIASVVTAMLRAGKRLCPDPSAEHPVLRTKQQAEEFERAAKAEARAKAEAEAKAAEQTAAQQPAEVKSEELPPNEWGVNAAVAMQQGKPIPMPAAGWTEDDLARACNAVIANYSRAPKHHQRRFDARFWKREHSIAAARIWVANAGKVLDPSWVLELDKVPGPHAWISTAPKTAAGGMR